MQLTNLLLLTAAVVSPVLSLPSDQQVLTPPSTEDCGCHCNDNPAFSKIKHALKKANIVPSILPPFTPKCFVRPTYTANGKKHKSVSLGNKLKHHKTKKSPNLKFYCPNMTSTTGLTLALTDPDAPSKEDPKWGEMCHWIVRVGAVGRPREEGEGLEFEVDFEAEVESKRKSDELVKYKAPGPPKGTGYHRYVFVLLEGDNTNLTKPEDRQHWGTGKKGHGVWDWAKGEGLEVIGANWFVEKQKK